MTSPANTIREIRHDDALYALIIPAGFHASGVNFCTPGDFSQQLAFMSHPAGKTIPPHLHNPVSRDITLTLEVLFIRKGRLRVDFYDDTRTYFESHVLSAGDVILLSSGGHGFEALDDLEMIEVKQGPYAGDRDKSVFKGVCVRDVIVKSGEPI
jgi:mannose-6-phosphate isomerase-like protein (cupin superfamily)